MPAGPGGRPAGAARARPTRGLRIERVAATAVLMGGLLGLLPVARPAGGQEPAPGGPPTPAVHRFSVRTLVSVDVTGRLVVGDRSRASAAVAEAVSRLGGTRLARRADPVVPGGEVIELLLPREAFPAFTAELARLGRWAAEHHVAELPDPVRVVLHVAE
jgi:hypothetical protein